MSGAGNDPKETAVHLLKQGLFLRMYGERPPGANLDDLQAETWGRWDTEVEHFLRSLDG